MHGCKATWSTAIAALPHRSLQCRVAACDMTPVYLHHRQCIVSEWRQPSAPSARSAPLNQGSTCRTRSCCAALAVWRLINAPASKPKSAHAESLVVEQIC